TICRRQPTNRRRHPSMTRSPTCSTTTNPRPRYPQTGHSGASPRKRVPGRGVEGTPGPVFRHSDVFGTSGWYWVGRLSWLLGCVLGREAAGGGRGGRGGEGSRGRGVEGARGRGAEGSRGRGVERAVGRENGPGRRMAGAVGGAGWFQS